jgi:hypothetical protein
MNMESGAHDKKSEAAGPLRLQSDDHIKDSVFERRSPVTDAERMTPYRVILTVTPPIVAGAIQNRMANQMNVIKS